MSTGGHLYLPRRAGKDGSVDEANVPRLDLISSEQGWFLAGQGSAVKSRLWAGIGRNHITDGQVLGS